MAKKNPPKTKAAAAFEPSLLTASATDALAALQTAEERADALIQAWVDALNAGALDAVAASDSPHRKAAKRALAVLRSRGVSLPERKVVASVPAPALTHEAWFLPPDPSGVSMITIGSHSTGDRWNVVDVHLHEVAGLLEVSAGEATGSSIREAFKRSKAARGLVPAPVSLDWARWRIAEARKMNATSGLVTPLGLDTAAPLLEPVPSSEPPSPLGDVKLEDADIDARAKASATLHNDPEFRGWLPDSNVMQELLAKVGERLGEDPSKVPSDKVNEILQEEVTLATDRFFTPDVRRVIASRMRDCAISVQARAGQERARDVLATAEASTRAGLITAPPSEIPFLRSFFEKGLAVMAASTGGKISIPVRQPPPATPEAQSGQSTNQ